MSNMKLTKRHTEKTKEAPQKPEKDDKKDPKYGPMPKLTTGHRTWTRAILIFGILFYVWFTTKKDKEQILAKQKEFYERRGQEVTCDPDYIKEIKKYPGCIPLKCGRFVTDSLVTRNDAVLLRSVAQKGINIVGGSSGGASILDLHSGAVSYGEKFTNFYSLEDRHVITPYEFDMYKTLRRNIQKSIAEHFGIEASNLYLTHPTFFSRLTNQEPQSPHDEYWHEHVDKVTYESFHYTSLLYLNDYGRDFKGGRFKFVDNPAKNVTVEPRTGRVLMFTSGAENPHLVERVKEGTRYAITVSFTCDSTQAISDPVNKS